MNSYAVAEWKDFFVAVAGASATLAGLLFVGLSINLTRINELRIADRAGEALILLGGALTACLLGLIPQPLSALGFELLFVTVVLWCVTTNLHIQAIRLQRYDTPYHGFLRVVFAQAASLPLLIGAVSFLVHTGGGLYWVAVGLVLSLLVSMFNSWVLLVEIMR